MTARDRYGRATQAWRDGGIPVADSDPGRDARAVDALRASIRRAPGRNVRNRARRALVALAAAAVAIGSLAAVLHFRPFAVPAPAPVSTLRADDAAALVIRHGTTRFADPRKQTPLEAGDEVSVAAGGRAQVTLPSGALVDVAATTRLRVASLERDEVIRLVRGTVSLRVPKLASPRTLSVVAPDATVVVHGTRFSVTVNGDPPPARASTSVQVIEGEVAVVFGTGHLILRSGDSWRSADPALPNPPPAGTNGAVPDEGVKSASPDAALESSPGSARASNRPSDELTLQNRLYRAALSARDRGDEEQAIELLSDLLERYPESPLAAEARLLRARLRDAGR
jgi:ferric-dicitrate binding protein FerR (iron transport regulator)